MIFRKDSLKNEAIKAFKGGNGEFQIEHLVNGEMLGEAGRLFAKGTLKPGHSVGWHIHENDMEICCILSGSGTVMDGDGKEYSIGEGDVHICPPGCGHEIVNTGQIPLIYLAVVLYPERSEVELRRFSTMN